MSSDPEKPILLVSVNTDAEAGVLLTALEAAGVEANPTGGYTAGGRIGIAANVDLWVRQRDLDRARSALREIQLEAPQIDWTQVDVGEADDHDADESPDLQFLAYSDDGYFKTLELPTMCAVLVEGWESGCRESLCRHEKRRRSLRRVWQND